MFSFHDPDGNISRIVGRLPSDVARKRDPGRRMDIVPPGATCCAAPRRRSGRDLRRLRHRPSHLDGLCQVSIPPACTGVIGILSITTTGEVSTVSTCCCSAGRRCRLSEHVRHALSGRRRRVKYCSPAPRGDVCICWHRRGYGRPRPLAGRRPRNHAQNDRAAIGAARSRLTASCAPRWTHAG